MNNSGDAAEQIVRLSLEGVEVAARITGAAAKEIAVLLVAALKSDNKKLKSHGKARLESMLQSGKPLEIFSVKDSDLKAFTAGAKEYGIVYCVLRNTKNSPDGLCDIMVKADDAPKINRLVERFKFATVDKAKIESEVVAARKGNIPDGQAATDEPEALEINNTETLLDELLGSAEGKTAVQAKAGQEQVDAHPLAGGGTPPINPPSGPTSENKNKSAGATSSKPSVREALREIKASKKAQELDSPARGNYTLSKKTKDSQKSNSHNQTGGKIATSKTTTKGNHVR